MRIEELLAQELPDRPGYRFGDADEVRAGGDVRRVPIYGPDGEDIGFARGVTGDDLKRSADALAEAHERGQE
jgi:hypothetical protein